MRLQAGSHTEVTSRQPDRVKTDSQTDRRAAEQTHGQPDRYRRVSGQTYGRAVRQTHRRAARQAESQTGRCERGHSNLTVWEHRTPLTLAKANWPLLAELHWGITKLVRPLFQWKHLHSEYAVLKIAGVDLGNSPGPAEASAFPTSRENGHRASRGVGGSLEGCRLASRPSLYREQTAARKLPRVWRALAVALPGPAKHNGAVPRCTVGIVAVRYICLAAPSPSPGAAADTGTNPGADTATSEGRRGHGHNDLPCPPRSLYSVTAPADTETWGPSGIPYRINKALVRYARPRSSDELGEGQTTFRDMSLYGCFDMWVRSAFHTEPDKWVITFYDSPKSATINSRKTMESSSGLEPLR